MIFFLFTNRMGNSQSSLILYGFFAPGRFTHSEFLNLEKKWLTGKATNYYQMNNFSVLCRMIDEFHKILSLYELPKIFNLLKPRGLLHEIEHIRDLHRAGFTDQMAMYVVRFRHTVNDCEECRKPRKILKFVDNRMLCRPCKKGFDHFCRYRESPYWLKSIGILFVQESKAEKRIKRKEMEYEEDGSALRGKEAILRAKEHLVQTRLEIRTHMYVFRGTQIELVPKDILKHISKFLYEL